MVEDNYYKDPHLDVVVNSMKTEVINTHGAQVEQVSYTLFEPGGDPMFEYEELNTYPELKALSKDEYSFCWYYASETSLYSKIEDERIKILACIDYSFGVNMDKQLRAKLLNKDFPERFKVAMKRLRSFNGGIRMRAKAMLYASLRNIEKMISVDEESIGLYSPEDAKKYSSMIKESLPVIDEIINKIENGYGIKTKSIINRNFSTDNLMQKVIEAER